MFRSKAEKKVADAGYDPARLPPGQSATEKWPVLRAERARDRPRDVGLPRLGRSRESDPADWEELKELPATEVTIDIHCVTRWSRFDTSFRGVQLGDAGRARAPKPDARFVVAHAEQGFTANLPLAALEDDDSLIAYEADGEPLTPEHGWPLRLVVPSRYFWKSAKWLRGIELARRDQPGFWERYGYHNHADYWKEERYGF